MKSGDAWKNWAIGILVVAVVVLSVILVQNKNRDVRSSPQSECLAEVEKAIADIDETEATQREAIDSIAENIREQEDEADALFGQGYTQSLVDNLEQYIPDHSEKRAELEQQREDCMNEDDTEETLTCAADTHDNGNGGCEPDDQSISCPDGEHPEDNNCVAD